MPLAASSAVALLASTAAQSPEFVGRPALAPKVLSAAAKVTALPERAMNFMPHVADGKQPLVTVPVVP